MEGRKRSYKFIIKRPYEYLRKYKLRKESLLEKVGKFFSKRKEAKKLKKESKKKKSINYSLIFILLFVFAVLGVIVYFSFLLLTFSPPPLAEPFINSIPINSFYGDYGNIFEPKKALFVKSRIMNDNGEVSLSYYLLPPSSFDLVPSIYFFDGDAFSINSQSLDRFYEELSKEARKKGFNVEKVDAYDLEDIPPGSFLIVANGIMPFEVVEKMSSLIDRKVNIVYIGLKPSVTVLKDGKPFNYGFNFLDYYGVLANEQRLSPSLLRMRNPYYSLSPSYLFDNSVSITGRKSLLIIFPNNLERGWANLSDSAKDVIDVITSSSIPKGVNKDFIEIPYEEEENIILQTEDVGKAILYFKSSNGDFSSYDFYSVSYFDDNRGYLLPIDGPTFLPYGISNSPIEFSYNIFLEGKDRDVFNILVKNENKEVIDSFSSELFLGVEEYLSYSKDKLNTGVYLFEIRKDGESYLKSIVEISPLRVVITPDFERSLFFVEFFSGDEKVVVDNIKIYYEGQLFEFSGVNEGEIDLFNYFGGATPSGFHTFVVDSGVERFEVVLYNPPKTAINRILFDNPLNFGMLIMSVILFIVGSFVKPKEDIRFIITIPKFLPTERIKVGIKPSEIIEIFEKVNEYYKWKHTPLKISEVKMGLARLRKNPIIVSDFNLEYVLDEMVAKGYLKKALDYYGVVDWEKETGLSILELAMFRKVRDVCIDRAIPFYRGNKRYDVKVNIGYRDVYLLFFEPSRDFISIVRKSLSLVKQSNVIVIVPSEDEKEIFKDLIYQSGKELSLFRHYLERGLVSVMTIKEFSEMLKEVV